MKTTKIIKSLSIILAALLIAGTVSNKLVDMRFPVRVPVYPGKQHPPVCKSNYIFI